MLIWTKYVAPQMGVLQHGDNKWVIPNVMAFGGGASERSSGHMEGARVNGIGVPVREDAGTWSQTSTLQN